MIASGPSALLYDIAGTSVRIDFALGVFWKKAVWPDTTNELGPYAEEIRSFLRGGAFPLRCELTVWVHRKETKLACVAFDPVPLGRTGPGSYGYKFMIPGINFLLSLGADPGELHVGAGRISVCDGDQILLNALRALGPLPDLPGPKRRVVR